MESIQWYFVITVIWVFSFSTGIFSSLAGYRRRARSDCYLPTGPQYDRSMYIRVHSRTRTPLSPGYRIRKGGRVLTVCRKDIQHDAILHSSTSRCIYGKWRPSLPDCIALERCGNAPIVPNTNASEKWQSSKSYPHDYVVTYTCDRDLFLSGDNKIRCNDGTWSEIAFSCSEATNPDICRQKTVSNGEVTEITATTYKVTCHRGFDLATEQPVFTCNNGEWLEEIPRCKPRVCPFLSHVSYDIISSPLHHLKLPVYGSTIRIRCPTGQAPYRDIETASCVDGIWEPFRPFCRRYCTIQQQYRFYSRFTYLQTSMTVNDNVGHGQRILQRCLGGSKTTKHRCFHGRWRPGFRRCPKVDTDIPAPGYTDELYNKFNYDLNHGCNILSGKSFDFMSEDETILYDDNDTVRHGITIKQVCEGDEDNLDKHHLVKCNNGTWRPDLQACPNEDCDAHFDAGKVRSGQMISPVDLEHSFLNSICSYTFHMDASEIVKVTFQEFEILASDSDDTCKSSYLEYRSKEAGGNLVKLCGNSVPPVIEESGPEVVITLNTLNADVVIFKATFEFITVDVSCQNPNSLEFQYKPMKDSYKVNDSLKVWCQDETRYLTGSDIWMCTEDGQWHSTAECIPYESCQLLELSGVTYYIDDNEGSISGSLEHDHTAVVYKTCESTGDLEDLGSYLTVDCVNGSLSGEILPCQEEPRKEHVTSCLPPSMTGIMFSPIKDLYHTDDIVNITGCSDAFMIPVGVSELVCQETGAWIGSVQCLSYCENGVTFFRETKYSFFKRTANIVYKQLNGIDKLSECKERCYGHQEFMCRSFEYREDKSACILTDTEPNDKQFTAINFGTRSAVIYELVCDDRCSIPDSLPDSVIYTDQNHQKYVPRQQVYSGTVVTVICRTTFRSRKITCMGGLWDFDNFC